MPGAGSAQASFPAPLGALSRGCSSLGFPCRNIAKLGEGCPSSKASIAGISPFFWPSEEWVLCTQWRGSSSGTRNNSHCPIPYEMIKTSGREEQFSFGASWLLCVCSSPIHALHRFPVTQHWPHFQWSDGTHYDRAQKTRVKGLSDTWRCLSKSVFGKMCFVKVDITIFYQISDIKLKKSWYTSYINSDINLKESGYISFSL